MRTVFYAFTALCVVALAFWAYRENYATQQALKDTGGLHDQIREAHARLAVLKAEWAYLNRPDRLHNLVELNFDKLGLFALRPDQFGLVDQVAYPQTTTPELTLDFTTSVEVSTQNAPVDEDAQVQQ
ncbi:MAG: cell division protein FtsL [Paracoccaceae bacterium]